MYKRNFLEKNIDKENVYTNIFIKIKEHFYKRKLL